MFIFGTVLVRETQKEIEGLNLKPRALAQFGALNFKTMERTCKKCGETKPIEEFYKIQKRINKRGEYVQYYNTHCKECNKIVAADYAKRNPERIKGIAHKCYINNKSIIRGKHAEYYVKKKDSILAHNKTYRQINADKLADYHREYNAKNKDKRAKYRAEYYKMNKVKNDIQSKQYRSDHKKQLSEYFKEYNIVNKGKRKEYRIKNSAKLYESRRKYIMLHKNELNDKRKDYYYAHHDRSKEWGRTYRLNNLDIIKERQKKYRLFMSDEQRKKRSVSQRKYEKKIMAEMLPEYITGLIRGQTGIPIKTINQYPELIELKKVQLKIKRLIKNQEDENSNRPEKRLA